MKKIKKLIFIAIILVIVSVFTTRVEAVGEYEEIMNSVPDVIMVNISKSETLDEKIKQLIVPEEYELVRGSSSGDSNFITKIGLGLKLKNDLYGKTLISKNVSVIYTTETIEKIKKVLPNKIELNIPECEYQKAEKLIKEKIFKDAAINEEQIKKENIRVDVGIYFYNGGNIKEAGIVIYLNNSNVWYQKTDVVYNNSDKYNKEDEKYVKNLKISSPKYYEVALNYLKEIENKDLWFEYHKLMSEEYEKRVNDKTITIRTDSGVGGADGGLNLWTWDIGTSIAIFKDGVLYDVREMGQECTVPVINVPSTVTDDEINNYVIKEITKFYDEFGSKITGISKGTGDMNIPDGYTVYSEYGMDSYIIIKRNKETNIVDKKFNIKLSAKSEVVSEDTKIVVSEIKSGEKYDKVKESLNNESNRFEIYDINLLRNDIKIQPNGKVKISLPIPDDYDTSKLTVYRVKEDGTKIEYNVSVEGKYAVFETDHFSIYVLAEKNNEITEKNENDKIIEHKLDETPKTGESNMNVIVSTVVSVISSIGIAILKRF